MVPAPREAQVSRVRLGCLETVVPREQWVLPVQLEQAGVLAVRVRLEPRE